MVPRTKKWFIQTMKEVVNIVHVCKLIPQYHSTIPFKKKTLPSHRPPHFLSALTLLVQPHKVFGASEILAFGELLSRRLHPFLTNSKIAGVTAHKVASTSERLASQACYLEGELASSSFEMLLLTSQTTACLRGPLRRMTCRYSGTPAATPNDSL